MKRKMIRRLILCFGIAMCFKVSSQEKIYFPLQNQYTESIYSGLLCNSNQLFFTGAFTGTIEKNKSAVDALGDSDIFVLSVDSNNHMKWVITGGGILDDKHFISEYGKLINENSNDDIIVSGVFNHSALFNKSAVLKSNGYTDIFLLCLSRQGDIKWMKNFGGSGNESITDMAVNPVNNQIAISGILSTPYNINKQTKRMSGSSAFLAIFNDKGRLLRLFEQSKDSLFWSQSVCFDKKNNIYWALNYTNPVGNPNTVAEMDQNCYIKKISQEGELIWDFSFGGLKYDEIKKIITDNENNLVITGTFRGKLNIRGKVISSYGDSDIFIARFSQDGELIKMSNYGGSGYDEVNSMTVTNNNEYLITGVFEEFIFDSVHHSFDRDAFILITNDNLSPLGFNTLKGPGMEKLYSVSVNGSNCLISGFYNNDIYFNGKKYSSQGEEDPVFLLFNIDQFKDRHKINSRNFSENLRVWPNPANAIVNIDYTDKRDCESINLLSLSGIILKRLGKKELPCIIDISEFNKGIYLLEITIDDEIFNKKIVIY